MLVHNSVFVCFVRKVKISGKVKERSFKCTQSLALSPTWSFGWLVGIIFMKDCFQLPDFHGMDLDNTQSSSPESGWPAPHSSRWCRDPRVPGPLLYFHKCNPKTEGSHRPGCNWFCCFDSLGSSKHKRKYTQGIKKNPYAKWFQFSFYECLSNSRGSPWQCGTDLLFKRKYSHLLHFSWD